MSDLLDEAHEFLLCMDKTEYADALFAFTLLEWAGNARRRAAGREVKVSRCGEVTTQFGPWWRTPKGIVIKYDQCGYNGVQCFSTPVALTNDRRLTGYLWHPFVIRWQRVPAFLASCEYLGKEMPQAEIDRQVRRFARLKPPEQVQHVLPIQQELWL